MTYNIEDQVDGIQHRRRVRAETVDGTKLKEVNDFKYLGLLVDSTEEDILIRKGLVWVAANRMKKYGNQISQGTSLRGNCA